MRDNLSNGAALAGALLIAMPAFDLAWGSGTASVVHAVVGFFGFALLSASAAGLAGKEN